MSRTQSARTPAACAGPALWKPSGRTCLGLCGGEGDQPKGDGAVPGAAWAEAACVVNCWISPPTRWLPSYLTWISGKILACTPDLKSRVTPLSLRRTSLSRRTTSSRFVKHACISRAMTLLFRRPPWTLTLLGGSAKPPTPSRRLAKRCRDSPRRLPARSRIQPFATPCSCAGPAPASEASVMGEMAEDGSSAKEAISEPTVLPLAYLTMAALTVSAQTTTLPPLRVAAWRSVGTLPKSWSQHFRISFEAFLVGAFSGSSTNSTR
mmetsp:Transcript_98209/g.305771  ORF Transcript_98209/g.305771 Transcript_98209/m.305771 type:complete len:265 (-) Transcript_98209:425-1219(-)